MPAIFSSDGQSFGFLKTEASVRMGLKAVFMLNCCSVRFILSDIPWTWGTTAGPAGSRWWFCGSDLGWAALRFGNLGNLSKYRSVLNPFLAILYNYEHWSPKEQLKLKINYYIYRGSNTTIFNWNLVVTSIQNRHFWRCMSKRTERQVNEFCLTKCVLLSCLSCFFVISY